MVAFVIVVDVDVDGVVVVVVCGGYAGGWYVVMVVVVAVVVLWFVVCGLWLRLLLLLSLLVRSKCSC